MLLKLTNCNNNFVSGIRNGNHMGDEAGYLCSGNTFYDHGAHHTIYLRTMVGDKDE